MERRGGGGEGGGEGIKGGRFACVHIASSSVRVPLAVSSMCGNFFPVSTWTNFTSGRPLEIGRRTDRDSSNAFSRSISVLLSGTDRPASRCSIHAAAARSAGTPSTAPVEVPAEISALTTAPPSSPAFCLAGCGTLLPQERYAAPDPGACMLDEQLVKPSSRPAPVSSVVVSES